MTHVGSLGTCCICINWREGSKAVWPFDERGRLFFEPTFFRTFDFALESGGTVGFNTNGFGFNVALPSFFHPLLGIFPASSLTSPTCRKTKERHYWNIQNYRIKFSFRSPSHLRKYFISYLQSSCRLMIWFHYF